MKRMNHIGQIHIKRGGLNYSEALKAFHMCSWRKKNIDELRNKEVCTQFRCYVFKKGTSRMMATKLLCTQTGRIRKVTQAAIVD